MSTARSYPAPVPDTCCNFFASYFLRATEARGLAGVNEGNFRRLPSPGHGEEDNWVEVVYGVIGDRLSPNKELNAVLFPQTMPGGLTQSPVVF